MNVLLGLEHGSDSEALSLLTRLRFSDANYDLTHVIHPFPWVPTGTYYGGFPLTEATITEADQQIIRQTEDDDANMVLHTAAAHLSAAGECQTHALRGNPIETLMDHADDTYADLVAVNASRQGAVLSLFTGSVARGLVTGAHQSVLLARGNAHRSDDAIHPIRAVLATDHSPYMNRCIERFLRFHPQGISHLTVLTAYPEDSLESVHSYLPNLVVSPAVAMHHDLEERNRSLIQRLRDVLGASPITITSKVSGESVECAIRDAMKEADADLLIVGAQGHSLLTRLTLGSISFRQAMIAPYSVLVLRVSPVETAEIREVAKVAELPGSVALTA
ncbi:MAG: universal stress protein [Fibrella sp.]|nr:universal stress protein [Armatimonadota bacterium]